MCVCGVQRVNPKLDFAELGALFFLQWMGLAAWFVPLTLVLSAHGLQRIQPLAFATSAIAAFISPLFFGAMADRQMSPARVLRWLCLATAAALTLACVAIQRQWPVLAPSVRRCGPPAAPCAATLRGRPPGDWG